MPEEKPSPHSSIKAPLTALTVRPEGVGTLFRHLDQLRVVLERFVYGMLERHTYGSSFHQARNDTGHCERMREKLYTGMMGGIGSVYNAWRHLVKRVLMGDELAWLSVSGAATLAECLSSFAHARSLHVVGGAQAGHIGMVMDQSRWRGLHLKMTT